MKSTIQILGNRIHPNELPFVEKFRPKTIKEVIGQDQITQIIDQFIQMKQIPHLLFYGPPGVGKTSLALACAQKINGLQLGLLTLMINASDKNDINTIRSEIKTFVTSKSLWDNQKLKLVIMDEVDYLTSDSQQAMRYMMERYSTSVRFILICNDCNTLIPALQSRCTRFRFNPLSTLDIQQQIYTLCQNENIKYESDKTLNTIAYLSCGDLRTAYSILESLKNQNTINQKQTKINNNDDHHNDTNNNNNNNDDDQKEKTSTTIHSTDMMIKTEDVYKITGKPTPDDVTTIFDILLNESMDVGFKLIWDMMEKNQYSLLNIIQSLHEIIIFKATLPQHIFGFLLIEFGKLEIQLHKSSHDLLQLGCLLGIFSKVVTELQPKE